MININELRFGNWIDAGDEGFVQVKQLYYNHVNGWHVKGVDPIPPTPKILQQCGFIKDRNGDFLYQVDPAIYIKLIIGAAGIVYPHYMESTPEDCNITALKSVQHLHELQNLFFALTGTELVIKSFSHAS